MKQTLEIAPGLHLPMDVAAKRLAFLGMTGSGKTYAAMKLAEEMIEAGIQVVIVDIVGVWWGLRVAANGKSPGIQIPVFGGLHGDVPIEPLGGELIADVIVQRNISAVIDISQLDSDTDALRFARDFGKHIFELRKKHPAAMMVFLEECQEIVPENPGSQLEIMCLHAWKRVGKIGRNFGIGVSFISQRPQEISKKVLNLSEVVFAFQMSGSHERKAVKDWIHQVGGDNNIVDILPRLEVGQPHVYSPRWLKVSKVFHIAKRKTFDASSTPEVGEQRGTVMKPLSEGELKELSAKMAETIERAKADDPKELKRKLAERDKRVLDLEKQLSRPAAAPSPAAADPERLKKEFERGAKSVKAEIGKQLRAYQKAHELRLHRANAALAQVATSLTQVSETTEICRVSMGEMPPIIVPDLDEIIANADKLSPPPPPKPIQRVDHSRFPDHARAPEPVRKPVQKAKRNGDGPGLTPVAQRIIDQIAELNSLGIDTPDRLQVAILSGYSNVTSTGFAKAIGALRTAGLINYPNTKTVALTDDGAALANQPGAPLSSNDLQSRLMRLVQPKAAEILSALIEQYPEPIDRQKLAEAVGYTNVTSTGFAKAIGRLRTMGLLEYPSTSTAVASSLLFLE